jgi:hypothetical protein
MRHAVSRPHWSLRWHRLAFLTAVVVAVSVVAGLLGWLTA